MTWPKGMERPGEPPVISDATIREVREVSEADARYEAEEEARLTREALLIESNTQAVREGQRLAKRYSSDRIGACPPSREFPYTHEDPSTMYEAQLVRWRQAYPDHTEESFTHPRVRAVLQEAGLVGER